MNVCRHPIWLAALIAFCTCTVAGSDPTPERRPGPPPAGRLATAAVAATEGEQPAAERGNPLWAVHLGSLSATRERPLFSASRRPSPPAAVIAKAAAAITVRDPPPETPPVRLVGVITGPGLQMGIFAADGAKSFSTQAGEAVLGWTVRDVEPRAVTLERAGRHVRLELAAGGSRSAATPLDPSAPVQGTPVGAIIPYATASR